MRAISDRPIATARYNSVLKERNKDCFVQNTFYSEHFGVQENWWIVANMYFSELLWAEIVLSIASA